MPRRTLLGFCLVLLAGCEAGGISSDWTRIEPPVEAPGFTLAQLNGGEVSLADHRGRVVIMEFWATWCAPCRYSTPSLEVIYRKHRDRGMTVLLVNQQESPEVIRAWAGNRFTAPILLDEQGAVASRYGVNGIPSLFVIDQEGRLVYAHDGYRGGLERNLKLILDELLNGVRDTDAG